MTSLPGTDERVVFRVIPSFRSRLVKLVSGIELSTAAVIVAVAVAVFITKAFVSVGATGILAALGLLLCGILGFVSGYRKEIWAISSHLILAVVGLAFCLALIGAGVTALHYEATRNSTHSQYVREAIDICAITMGTFGSLLTIISTLLCCTALFYTCCHTAQGVTYINEPNVPYNSTTDIDDIKLGESAVGVDEEPNKS